MLTLTAIVVVVLLTVTMWPLVVMGVATMWAAACLPAEPNETIPVGVRITGVACGAAMAFVGSVVWYTFVFRVVPLMGVS